MRRAARVLCVVGLLIALEGVAGSDARGPSQAAERPDPRYELSVHTDASALRVVVEPRQGWHLALEAGTSLELEGPPGVFFDSARLRNKDAVRLSERVLEYAAAYRGAASQDDPVRARLKFGICQDGDEGCAIVIRQIQVSLPSVEH